MDDRLLLHLLAATLYVIIGIRALVIFLRWRTKYNLATVAVIAILLGATIADLLFPGRLVPPGGRTVQILSLTISLLWLYVFLFYPEARGFLSRRKMRNK